MTFIKSRLAKNLVIAFVLIVVSLAVREVINPYKYDKLRLEKNTDHGVSHEPVNLEKLVIKGPYNFTDQSGSAFEISQWFDKPLIISYIFTKCTHACPTLSASISKFVKNTKLKLGVDYRIVSVGFDTANDTPEALQKFGAQFADSFDSWRFVTGSDEQIKKLSEKVGVHYKPSENGEWSHTMGVTIIAPGGAVYGRAHGIDYPADSLSKQIIASLKS
jgi:protein SCO1/2